MSKAYSFPSYIKTEIDRIFAEKKWSWNSKNLAQDILQLSDYYIQDPTGETPWDQPWAQRAGLVYFWPLNSVRLLKIENELKSQGFFMGLDEMIDFGAGTGAATWVLQDYFPEKTLIERYAVPQKWFPQFQWSQKLNVFFLLAHGTRSSSRLEFTIRSLVDY